MSGLTTLSPDAQATWLALGGTLAALAEVGCATPCQVDPHPFTSDHPAERREAAIACVSACPALSACRRFAEAQGETWHVWAGEDRTSTTRGRNAAAKTKTVIA